MLVPKTLWQEHEVIVISFSQIRIYMAAESGQIPTKLCECSTMVWHGMGVEKLTPRSTETHKNVWKDIHRSANRGYLQVAGI